MLYYKFQFNKRIKYRAIIDSNSLSKFKKNGDCIIKTEWLNSKYEGINLIDTFLSLK